MGAPWPLRGPRGRLGWEQVRLHAWYTERILAQAPVLGAVGAVAASTHERLDGAGYHRGAVAAGIPRLPRLLAAADVAVALAADRPHRPALAPAARADALREEVRAGRLDRLAVDAVLGAEGLAPAWRRPTPLSDREEEVLLLVARGKTNREIGQVLGISPKTVQHHVAHVYDKIGVYSRAGAALYAMEHGLFT